MVHRLLLRAALSALLIGAGCSSVDRNPYNPFKIQEDEFYTKAKIMALAPLAVPVDLENPEPVRATFEALIGAKLRQAGFSVVPSQEYAEIWKRRTEELGGYFDPMTGRRDVSKFNETRELSLRELVERFHIDSILYPGIVVMNARLVENQASWDGTSELLDGGRGFFDALFTPKYDGTVKALSLMVHIVDVNGFAMYSNAGGIRALKKISAGKLVPVPQDEIFTAEERNDAAVRIALEALLKRSTMTKARQEKP